MFLNIVLCKYFNVGSAIIAYFIYVCIIIGLYYISFYKKLLGLSRKKMIHCFVVPTAIAVVVYIFASLVPISVDMFRGINERVAYILVCLLKTMVWGIPYIAILHFCKIIDFKQLKK